MNNQQPERLYSFYELFNEAEINSLMAGNGLNENFKYKTSYKCIFEVLHTIDPITYLKDSEGRVITPVDLESGLSNYSHLSQRAIKHDLYHVLSKQVSRIPMNLELAINFVSRFTKVFTVNFDQFNFLILNAKNQFKRLSEFESRFLRCYHNVFGHANSKNRQKILGSCRNVNSKSIGRFPRLKDLEDRRIISEIIQEIPGNAKLTFDNGFVDKDGKFVWNENSQSQTVFFLHGGMHLYYHPYTKVLYLISPLYPSQLELEKQELEITGTDFICVLEGNKYMKRFRIEENQYLTHCWNSYRNLTGTIFFYGMEFCSTKKIDDHIWEALKHNSGIKNIYISIFHDQGTDPTDKLRDARKKATELYGEEGKKVKFYDANLGMYTPISIFH